MFLTEFEKSNGEKVIFPQGIKMMIEETSNGVYQIKMFDEKGRNVDNHGIDLENMVTQALTDLKKMNAK